MLFGEGHISHSCKATAGEGDVGKIKRRSRPCSEFDGFATWLSSAYGAQLIMGDYCKWLKFGDESVGTCLLLGWACFLLGRLGLTQSQWRFLAGLAGSEGFRAWASMPFPSFPVRKIFSVWSGKFPRFAWLADRASEKQ